MTSEAEGRDGTPLSWRQDIRRFLAGYYGVGTLLFWGLDIVLSAPIRASFIGRPSLRMGYYIGLLGLAVICRRRPEAAPAVGVLESSANLFLVLLSILLPIWSLPDQAAAGTEVLLPFNAWTLSNAFLTGCVLIYTFHRSREALERQIGGGKT